VVKYVGQICKAINIKFILIAKWQGKVICESRTFLLPKWQYKLWVHIHKVRVYSSLLNEVLEKVLKKRS